MNCSRYPTPDDADALRKVGDLVADTISAKKTMPEVEAVRRLLRAAVPVLTHHPDRVVADEEGVDVAWEALFGFGGVVLGSLTTAGLTVYKEAVTSWRENASRDRQYERERQAARDAFQRDSILASQGGGYGVDRSCLR